MLRCRLKSEYSKPRYASELASFYPVESRTEAPWYFAVVHCAGQGALPCLHGLINAGKLYGIIALLSS